MNSTTYGPARMVEVSLPAYVERVTADELLEAAHELVARLTYLATASALPGDESVAWREQREEAIDVVAMLASGLLSMDVPE